MQSELYRYTYVMFIIKTPCSNLLIFSKTPFQSNYDITPSIYKLPVPVSLFCVNIINPIGLRHSLPCDAGVIVTIALVKHMLSVVRQLNY